MSKLLSIICWSIVCLSNNLSFLPFASSSLSHLDHMVAVTHSIQNPSGAAGSEVRVGEKVGTEMPLWKEDRSRRSIRVLKQEDGLEEPVELLLAGLLHLRPDIWLWQWNCDWGFFMFTPIQWRHVSMSLIVLLVNLSFHFTCHFLPLPGQTYTRRLWIEGLFRFSKVLLWCWWMGDEG